MNKQAQKLRDKLRDLDGYVSGDYDPFNHVAEMPSPSGNFMFGKGFGVPYGYTVCLWGPPKGGKTITCNGLTSRIMADDPEACVIKFDTEFREDGQMTKDAVSMYGIDRDRYFTYSVNQPDLIFDRIKNEIAASIQDGLPVKMVIIDSITGIQGRRAMNAEGIMTQQIGDHAVTIQEGLKMILPIQRKYRFAVILTAHARAELDLWEQRRGNKIKMAAAFGVKHYAEYFVLVEQDPTKDGRTDILGNPLAEGEQRHRMFMKDSSMGPKGREASFVVSFNDNRGFVRQDEEIFQLGCDLGVIERPTNTTYVIGDRKWVGKPNAVAAFKSDTDLQKSVLSQIRLYDRQGKFRDRDAELSAGMESELDPQG